MTELRQIRKIVIGIDKDVGALTALLRRVYLHAKLGTALEADVRETLRALNALPDPDRAEPVQ